MRFSLRTRILFFTVLPIVTLTFATLWMVNRRISWQTEQGLREDLERASAVAENVLGARSRALEVAGQVIVRDPKFFSVLTIPGSSRDRQLRATVAGVAHDFNALTHSDLFEVFDASGDRLASAGRETSDGADPAELAAAALAGRAGTGIVVGRNTRFQVSATPVFAGGRVVGALLLGERIDVELADELKTLTRSEVTFLSRRGASASTLEDADDRHALLAALRASTDARANRTPTEMRGPHHVWLTLTRALPGASSRQEEVYVMQRALDTETAFLREIQTGLAELGVIALIVALLAGYLIAQRVTSPVQRLVRGAEEMERGNYDFPLEVRSHDEIGYLAARFHDMRQKQREYVSSLEEVARLKSEFISVASHELRTPISVIRAYRDLMADGGLGPVSSGQREALEAMARSVTSLTQIAEDATRMSQIESADLTLSKSSQELAGLCRAAAELAGRDAPGRSVRVELEIAPDLGSANVDGPRLIQAVANLIRNGIRFTPDGGSVTVRARRDPGSIEVAVTDTGVGIPPEKQRHVFERAFMLRESRNHHSSSTLEFNSAGIGLGLSIAAGIVSAHGGTILVESEVGRGSTFTILIPTEEPTILAAAA